MTGNESGTRHTIAEAFLTLELADSALAETLSTVENLTSRYVLDLTTWYDVVPVGRSALPGTILEVQRRMSSMVDDTRATVSSRLDGEIVRLKHLLWTVPLPDGPRRGGHLRDFATPGEPRLPPGKRYEATPLYLPSVPIDIDVARQGELGNCYLVCAINAVAHWNPTALATMVATDPEDETYVIVRVGGGTYRLPATLPVDKKTGREVYSTASDGSTLVAYLEKAAAAHLGSWSDLSGGDSAYALHWLVNERFAWVNSQPVSAMSDPDLDHALTFGACTVIAIPRQTPGSPASEHLKRLGARDDHGYSLRRYTARQVHLHDPHLDQHPRPMSVDDLKDVGAILTWCSDPHHPA